MDGEGCRQEDDHRLVCAMARGEIEALGTFYDRFSGPLYALCLRMTGDQAQAEAIFQEVCQTIWHRAATYDATQHSVFSWAVHLTRCTASGHLRTRGRRPRATALKDSASGGDSSGDEQSLKEAVVAESLGVSAAVVRQERAQAIRRMLGALPAVERQAIELAFFADLTHHEISARLGESPGTIKSSIRRGLLKLCAELKKQG